MGAWENAEKALATGLRAQGAFWRNEANPRRAPRPAR
jgi:hypothetical protein